MNTSSTFSTLYACFKRVITRSVIKSKLKTTGILQAFVLNYISQEPIIFSIIFFPKMATCQFLEWRW